MQLNIDIFNSLNNAITGAKSGEIIPVCKDNKLLKV